MNKPIWMYCPMRNDKSCGGTCSQPNMPDCPYLKYAEQAKREKGEAK